MVYAWSTLYSKVVKWLTHCILTPVLDRIVCQFKRFRKGWDTKMRWLSMSDVQRLIKIASGPFSYLNWHGYQRTTYAPLANVTHPQ